MSQFKVISGVEAIELSEKYNLQNSIYLDFFPEVRGSYSIFNLPDSNYLVVSSNFSRDCPAFIYYDFDLLKKTIEDQRFPVPSQNMNFLELNQEKILKFKDNKSFFNSFIRNNLNYNNNIKSNEDFRKLFETIGNKVKEKNTSKQDKEGLVVSFVLLYLLEIMEFKELEIEFAEQYTFYNRYYTPFIINNNSISLSPNFDFKRINPIASAWIYLEHSNYSKQYDSFCRSIGLSFPNY